MRKTMRFAVPLMLCLLLANTGAHAATKSGTYVTGTVVSSTFTISAGGQNISPIGGTDFTPTTSTVNVKIVDATGNGTPYSLCQENPGQAGEVPNLCGDGDDVQVSSCSLASGRNHSGFVAGRSLGLFIFAADGVCDGVGTAGTYALNG